jgi:hypothetical protein
VTGQITEAIGRWADDVASLGGSDPLVRFRDLKGGTLDLSAADDVMRKKLLDGEPVRVSRLFPHDPLRTTAARSAAKLAERLWRLEAGHGIAAGYLATGLASWSDPTSTRRPNVPIILRRLEALPTGFAEPDLMLHVVGEPELNTRLLDAMAAQLGLRLTPADLLDPSGDLRYPVVVDRLREQAPPHVIDGFVITHRAVIGLMTTVADDVATDLRAHASLVASRPLVGLAAGTGAVPPAEPGAASKPDAGPPPIDLDSVQASVLDAARAGTSLAVATPAGSGATQVAAGLCAQAVVDGRSVLVVAESSSRLRGLRRRLAATGLGGATLDLSDGQISTAALARTVVSTIDAASRPGADPAGDPTLTPGIDLGVSAGDRDLLTRYVRALHERRPPRGVSAYQAISAAHAVPADQQSSVRISAESLAALDGEAMARLRADLAEFTDLDGLLISASSTPWFGATPQDEREAEQMVALVDRLRTELLPAARDRGARAAAEVGMPAPSTVADLDSLAALLADVMEVETVFTRDLWAEPVHRMAAASADRRTRRSATDGPGLRERRTLRAAAQRLARPGSAGDEARVAQTLAKAAEVVDRWAAAAHDHRLPRTGDNASAAVEAWTQASAALAALRTLHPQAVPEELDLAGVHARLSTLAADAHWARRLPRLTAAAADLADAGFGPVVADLRARRDAGETVTGESAVAVLDSVVAATLAEQIEQTDPVLARTHGPQLRETSQRWRQADAAASVAAADVARAAWGRRARAAATQRPVHVRVLRDTVEGRGPATTRELLAGSWSTILAARPVWLGGPLPVAAALPLDASFDLVVVLDAQAVALAHAVGVLARAEQVVVLGDPAQPPPSPTPLSVDTPDPRMIGQLPGAGVETPSVYAVLRDQLPSIDLTTRYGCRDARLAVAMPASRAGVAPAVPPGASASPPLLFRRVEQQMGTREQEESVDREVDEVVDLVRAHVAGRPHASLAVLTLGRLHAAAIEAALARACLTDSALAQALGPEADEPFLLRPVDDLNGERRDAVILSVGFGRARDGRLLYRYGPLNRPGGLRWLTAAVSTARRELVVVSSVTASDLEPRRLAADGLRGLRQLLATAEGVAVAGADDPGAHPALAQRPLDPVERAIASRLHAAGLPVLSGAGCGALALGFALEHPGRPGRGVLAVETEGGTFATLDDLRDRERMRPEQLMRAGWSVYRVCVSDWLRDPDAEVASITTAWREAADLADALDAARNAPAPPVQPGDSADERPGGESADEQPSDGREAAPSRQPRPLIAVGRPVEAYPVADLVAVAGWVEQGNPGLTEDEAVAALANEVGLAHPTGRSDTVLRRAVRAATIGASPGTEPTLADTATVIDDPLPTLPGADEDERSAERAAEEAAREQWLNDERPPHH